MRIKTHFYTILSDNTGNFALQAHIGWLAGLANATDQPYTANNTGGPSIKVSSDLSEKLKLQLEALISLTQLR